MIIKWLSRSSEASEAQAELRHKVMVLKADSRCNTTTHKTLLVT